MTMSTVEEAEKAVETFHQYVSSHSFLSSWVYSLCSLFGFKVMLVVVGNRKCGM